LVNSLIELKVGKRNFSADSPGLKLLSLENDEFEDMEAL